MRSGLAMGVVITDLPEITYVTISAASGIAGDVLQNDVIILASVDVPTGPNSVLSLQVNGREDAEDLVTSLRRAADEIEAAL